MKEVAAVVYYAKSENSFGTKIKVREHLKEVSDLAAKYGRQVGLEAEARAAGLLHDFGKYSEAFQEVIAGRRHHVDHAFPGAVLSKSLTRSIPEAVAAHHGSLTAYSCLNLRQDAIMAPSGKVSSLSGGDAYKSARDVLLSDFGQQYVIKVLSGFKSDKTSGLEHMMRTRMLLSCLVDADYSVSAYQDCHIGPYVEKLVPLDVDGSLSRLYEHHQEKVRGRCSKKMSMLRNMVWEDCGLAAGNGRNYLTLTAPTGSGKTMGFFRFVLERCKADITRKRVIFVLPFLSLTDQIYEEAKELIPGTILDTSTAEQSEENRELSSRWSAPCVVTTTVQFFTSLFSDRPGDVRKLHNLGDAVIVFDEIQSLPEHLSRVALQALNILVNTYGSTVLLSTATPPAYDAIDGLEYEPAEIMRDVAGCFALAEPEEIRWCPEPVSLEQIAQMALASDNCCVITNMKKHALAIYKAWENHDVKNIYLLSTDLCPEHRKKVVDEIARRQADGMPVHVSATQCIEAGVDLDFERVFRSVAPLSSVIQAAGRQNRGRNRPKGSMVVFTIDRDVTPGRAYPDSVYEEQSNGTLNLIKSGRDLTDLSTLKDYYRRRFSEERTKQKLMDAIRCEDYAAFSMESRIIKRNGMLIVVPYDREIYDEVLSAALDGHVTRGMMAKAVMTSVQSYAKDDVKSHCMELCIHNYRTGEDIHTGAWVLLPGHEACYDQDIGLKFGNTDGNDAGVFMI